MELARGSQAARASVAGYSIKDEVLTNALAAPVPNKISREVIMERQDSTPSHPKVNR
jgi:hypothetical protein